MSYRLIGEQPSSRAGRRFIIIKDLFLCDIGLMAGESDRCDGLSWLRQRR